MSKGKLDLRSVLVFLVILVVYCVSIVLGAGYGDNPGVILDSPADNSYDSDGNITFNCMGQDAYASVDNYTVYVNWTADEALFLPGEVTLVANYTVHGNGSAKVLDNGSDAGQFSMNFDDLVTDGDSDNLTIYWNCLACNNVTNCSFYPLGNRTVRVAKPTDYPAGGTPVVSFVSPVNNFVSAGTNVTINVSAYEDSDLNIGIDNFTLYYNVTNALHYLNQTSVMNTTDIDANRDGFVSWTQIISGDPLFASAIFELDSSNYSSSNGDVVIYYVRSCTNGTNSSGSMTEDVCGFTSGNRTYTYRPISEETSAPTFGSPLTGVNGSVDYDGAVNLSLVVSDDTSVSSVALYWNQSNASYDGDIPISGYVTNSTTNLTGFSGTSVTVQFNWTGLLGNVSVFTANGDSGWFSWMLYACDNATTPNCAFSDNVTFEVDRLPPVISSVANVTAKDYCDRINISITTSEESNLTVRWGNTSGALIESVSYTGFNLINEVSISPVDSYKTYYYNFTMCDEGGQCADSAEYEIRYGLPLCSGWSEYAPLDTFMKLGDIGGNVTAYTNNVSVRWWNRTSQSYLQWNDGFSANQDVYVRKGDAVAVWTDNDSVMDLSWWDGVNQNTTVDNDVFFEAGGWTTFGVLQSGRSFYNITLAGANDGFVLGQAFGNNLTFGTWLNNSVKVHKNWLLNQSLNENMTLPIPESVWFFSDENVTWVNRTVVEIGPDDGSYDV